MELARVTPGMAGRFIDTLSGGPAAKQQALSACRQYCTGLVQRHAMILNPFASVTGERYQVIEGRTPEIAISQARALLAACETASLVDLRDRALFGTLCYTGARIGAVLALRRGDLAESALRLREKGGKQRIIQVIPICQYQRYTRLPTCLCLDVGRPRGCHERQCLAVSAASSRVCTSGTGTGTRTCARTASRVRTALEIGSEQPDAC